MSQARTAHPARVGAYEWTAAFRAVPKSKPLTSAVVAVAYALSTWADKQTGIDIHPSQATVATAAGVSRKKAGEAMKVLAQEGWIDRTGTTSWGVGDYRLSVPASLPAEHPEVAALAKVMALPATSGERVRRQDAPSAEPIAEKVSPQDAPSAAGSAADGESSGRRGCVERTQGVSPQDAGGASRGRTTSSTTSSGRSSPTSPEEPAAAMVSDHPKPGPPRRRYGGREPSRYRSRWAAAE